jgi:hypothetical protein
MEAGSSSQKVVTARRDDDKMLGAIVFLAPQRNEGSMWGIDRFCMLLRAVRSVDQFLNTKYGPYPIYILVAKDYDLDPRHKDAAYTESDRALLRSWAPHSTIYFQEIHMYSQKALEPNVTREQILQWRNEGTDGAVKGRDLGYTSMCRLWSGRLQNMEFLNDHTYYLRMDDDSLLTADFPFDPFLRLQTQNLTYAYRRESIDDWGIDHLWRVSKPYLDLSSKQRVLPFLTSEDEYYGLQPYNNFHVSRVSFWRSPKWLQLWEEFNANHLFYKYRVGDANVHAIAIMMMEEGTYDTWPTIPYVHNTNDYFEERWGTKAWVEECQQAYTKWLD